MTALLKQHLIDPVICIRCNTCEETCPIKAISHDSRNYVVDPDICNGCGACISPCPTGSIDNWRTVPKAQAWSLVDQLSWDDLPAELHTLKQPAVATVVGNFRVTATDHDSDTHHVVLDFGSAPFPVLEGQSIGIIPPGTDGHGRPHHARQYSIASPRDGERPKYNNLSLTVKRVLVDHQGQPVRGVASNYVCDLVKGDQVKVIGPFGSTFLMPDAPLANLLMICTGTGSAPMRGMTERRRRLMQNGDGKLMLFFGARSADELPYFGPLSKLPKSFIDINLAFSRAPAQPRTYVQDLMRVRAADVAELLRSDATHIYVCGLKGMEDGVMDARRYAADQHGLDWKTLHPRLKAEGRLHLETY